jgi:hypothetical protein
MLELGLQLANALLILAVLLAQFVHPVLAGLLLFLGRLLIANRDDDLFRLLWRCGFLLGLLNFQFRCRLLFDDDLFNFSAH